MPVVVARRLATVHHNQRIVVMNAGRIVETGTHSQSIQPIDHCARLYELELHEEPVATQPAALHTEK